MIALDTNVIVRFLVRDDETQAQAVYGRLKQAEADREAVFVPLLVLLEVIWVLGSAYGKTRSEILSSIEDMKRMPIFAFESDEVIQSCGLGDDFGKFCYSELVAFWRAL